MLSKFNCNTLGWQTVRSVCLCIKQSITSVFTCSYTGCMDPYATQLYLYAEDMIKPQVIDLPFRFPYQVYCGVCNVSHDRPTLSISTSVTLRYICGSRWPYGLGVCLARKRSWVRFPDRHIPRFFSVGVFAVRELIYVVEV